jgi:hypothetical protein
MKVARLLRADLALRQLERALLQATDERVAAEQALAGERPYGREIHTVLQMRRGEAFWERTPLEATPARELGR